MPTPLFFIYHEEDKQHLKEIEKQLTILVKNQVLSYWHMGKLEPGEDKQKRLQTEFSNSVIVIPLVSGNLFYCADCMNLLEKAHHSGKEILPIIATKCLWEVHDILEQKTATPKRINDTEITPIASKSWGNPNEAYCTIAEAIKKAVENFQESNANIALPKNNDATLPHYTNDQIRAWQTDHCLRPTNTISVLIELLARRQSVNLTGGSGQGKSRLLKDIGDIAKEQKIQVALLNLKDFRLKYKDFLQAAAMQLELKSATQFANFNEVVSHLSQQRQHLFLLMIDNLEVLNEYTSNDPRYDAQFVASLNFLKDLDNTRLLCASQEWLKTVVFGGETSMLTLHQMDISPLTTDNIQNELKRRLPPKHLFLTKLNEQRLLRNAVQKHPKPHTLLDKLISRLISHYLQQKFKDILNHCINNVQ